MKDPTSYKKARVERKMTQRMLEEVKYRVTYNRKREDQQLAAASASGIPLLRVNNASFLKVDEEPPESFEIFDLGGKKDDANDQVEDTASARAKQFVEDMQKLDPAYQRYSKSLSQYILQNTLKYTNEHIFKNSAYYEKKHNVSRSEFIKIYNLFVSLSFITIKNSLQKSEAG